MSAPTYAELVEALRAILDAVVYDNDGDVYMVHDEDEDGDYLDPLPLASAAALLDRIDRERKP